MKNEGYILIIEDSSTQARQLESILERLGYAILIAYNAKDALAMLKRQKPVIVISDILMPEVDGYQLCKQIKTDDRLTDVPVVLLTQLSDPREIIKGLECGADDFIVKPCHEGLLLSRIQAILALKFKHDFDSEHVNILVVEDSPTQAEKFRYLLEERGYRVAVAANGKEGLAAAREIRPALVISDILMPVMDGYDLAYEIKHDKELGKTPIILVTSLTEGEELVRKVSVVADGYFTKPYEDVYLLSKIESLIRISKNEDIARDHKGLEVFFSGERYVITSGRRQILSFLLSTYESTVQQNHDLILMQRELQLSNEQLEERVAKRTQQLQASEAKYRTLLETSADAIVVVGKDGIVYFANRAAEELLGLSAQEIIGNSFHIPVAAGETRDVEINRKGGETAIAEMRIVETNWGDEKAILATLRDITDRKRMEEEVLRVAKLESLGILAGGIAHDFNNLMTGVMGNVSLAKTLVGQETEVYKVLEGIEKASTKTRDLTHQLLTFAKGGAPLKKTACIADLIRESANFVLRGSNTRCDFSIENGLWPLEVDEGQMSQVIHNLIINAEQAMPEGGIIHVLAENTTVHEKSGIPLKAGRYVRITVSDTGVGIPEKYLAKIFDPYFTTKAEGSGLGLASVYSIIKNHDGYISVTSRVGDRTSFLIYLPASQKEVLPTKKVEGKPIAGKGRVLVMDDEELIRDVAGRMLHKLGYGVEYARDGAEAIEMYKKARDAGMPFDAILMDLTIPGGMGGREAIQKLLEIDPDVKAIVSSGYSDDSIMSNFKKYGFSAVIAKPYVITGLSKIMHEVITETYK